MATLKETAMNYTGKKELFHLAKIPVDIEIKSDVFDGENGNKIPFNYIEIDGYKYTIKANILAMIRDIVSANPDAKFLKFQKLQNGNMVCIPIL